MRKFIKHKWMQKPSKEHHVRPLNNTCITLVTIAVAATCVQLTNLKVRIMGFQNICSKYKIFKDENNTFLYLKEKQ